MPLLFAINFYYPAKNVLGIYIEAALSIHLLKCLVSTTPPLRTNQYWWNFTYQ